MSTHLAIDIGGSHGRGVLGSCRGGKWVVQEIGSFSTRPAERNGVLVWDVFKMHAGIRSLISKAAQQTNRLDTIAVDTMGLAFALLDEEAQLIAMPLYTRVPQEAGLRREILDFFGESRLYSITGLEQEKLNSLYFLAKIKKEQPALLSKMRHFLMLPDLFNFWLTGIMHNEYTISTTSNLWDIGKQCWSEEILDYLGIDAAAFGPIYHCGQAVGRLKPELAASGALKNTMVVHVPSHDTASACFPLSGKARDQAFISAGTWGMTGCLLDHPVLTQNALREKFANEGAGAGSIKLLNNAPCMCILESCARTWYPRAAIPWAEIYAMAGGRAMSEAAIDLYHPYFRQQGDMPLRIRAYCSENGLPVPSRKEDVVSLVLSSIAHHFGAKFQALQQLTGRAFQSVVMLGGAARSAALMDLCSQCVGVPVLRGDPEASSKGNLLAQKAAFENRFAVVCSASSVSIAQPS